MPAGSERSGTVLVLVPLVSQPLKKVLPHSAGKSRALPPSFTILFLLLHSLTLTNKSLQSHPPRAFLSLIHNPSHTQLSRPKAFYGTYPSKPSRDLDSSLFLLCLPTLERYLDFSQCRSPFFTTISFHRSYIFSNIGPHFSLKAANKSHLTLNIRHTLSCIRLHFNFRAVIYHRYFELTRRAHILHLRAAEIKLIKLHKLTPIPGPVCKL